MRKEKKKCCKYYLINLHRFIRGQESFVASSLFHASIIDFELYEAGDDFGSDYMLAVPCFSVLLQEITATCGKLGSRLVCVICFQKMFQ